MARVWDQSSLASQGALTIWPARGSKSRPKPRPQTDGRLAMTEAKARSQPPIGRRRRRRRQQPMQPFLLQSDHGGLTEAHPLVAQGFADRLI